MSKAKLMMAGMLGSSGYYAGGPKGAALAALPFMEGPARSLILSKPYQAVMANPRYTQQADFAARFGRNSTASFGRDNPFLKFLAEAYPAETNEKSR